MRRAIGFLAALLLASTSFARPPDAQRELTEPEVEIDRVGDVDGTHPAPQKILQDTVWIADWTFDTGTPCDDTGWTHVDNHIRNDGSVYWHIETAFTTSTGMTGRSAAVGHHANACCFAPNGYDNDWYQAIRITYSGPATLSLDYIVDSEAGFDFLQIETDSACASFGRVNFAVAPRRNAGAFRTIEDQADGLITNGEWNDLALTDYGPGTHCAYIAFFADGGFSPCDGLQPTSVGEAIVIDNILITDGSGSRFEDFEDGTLDLGTFLNIADSAPFGTWARLYSHITDNDLCTENTTCAWLWTDHTTPTLANDPSQAYGPDGFVVKKWLDDIIVSPWVSLAGTPGSVGTVLQFRRFGGNFFASSQIVQSWSVRSKGTAGAPECISGWGHASSWNSLSTHAWITLTFDMTPNFDAAAGDLQVRFRTSDWQWISGAGGIPPFIPGPGPYLDRIRIGRRFLSGPLISEGIDARSQAQDCFPTEIHPGILPPREHHRPTMDRFGSCAFTMGSKLGRLGPNLITGDSIWVQVRGIRPGGETVTSVTWNGAIVGGPHAGKAPAPYAVGANGFFSFAADSARSSSGAVLESYYHVDLDDTYFRGGDELRYFWSATDAGGGTSSDPEGLTSPPGSLAEAEAATGGLLEVSFLPAIDWSQDYLDRIAADTHGDLEPTAAEIAASRQAHCILYVNHVNARRRSGDLNRTSFMYTLDRLGYREHYDVYDHAGMGNTNNHLGGRATIEQAQGYNLIVYDAGNSTPGRPIMPDGSDQDTQRVDQAGWFRSWLAQASLSEAGFATLWILGSNAVQEKPSNPLYLTTMGVGLEGTGQGAGLNPDVVGLASFTFDRGSAAAALDFAGDVYRLHGGCPTIRDYDALGTSGGTAVATHRYRSPYTQQQDAPAVVMNRNNAEAWNTILQSHPWFDMAPAGAPGEAPARSFLGRILGAVLPAQCLRSPIVTDAGGNDEVATPPRTVLHQNVPNPFNPTTTIRFDLAATGRVQLRIYDVAGRVVRQLLDEPRQAGFGGSVVWDGLSDAGRRVASGIYFYRLDTPGTTLVRKMLALK